MNNAQREYVIELLEIMIEEVKNGAQVPKKDIKSMKDMMFQWKREPNKTTLEKQKISNEESIEK